MRHPVFFTDPAQVPARETAQLVRTPPDRTLKAIITSHTPLAAPTHYYSRRTVPCAQPPNCDLCAKGLRWRLHAYISAVNLDDLSHCIIEFPAKQFDALAQWYRRFSSIRGLYIEASRPNNRPNGSITLIIKRPAAQPPSLPEPLDLQLILCRIWGVSPPQTQPQNIAPIPPTPITPNTPQRQTQPETPKPQTPNPNGDQLRAAIAEALKSTTIPNDL